MSTIQKGMTALFGIALATTLLLPNRQTPAVANAFLGGFRGILATAMGTGKTV